MKILLLLVCLACIAFSGCTSDGSSKSSWAPKVNGYIDVGAGKRL